MSLTKFFVPILSLREWEVWVSSEVCAGVGPILHENQLSSEPIKKIWPLGHLLATPCSRHQCGPSGHLWLSGWRHWDNDLLTLEYR